MSRWPDPAAARHRSGTGGHAAVIGGGMAGAGLLAARVLANHFERVTLIERDQLPPEMRARKGVPQGRMQHVLMPRGERIIERLFPGYSRELEAAGYLQVFGMLARPSALFAPRVLAAAARAKPGHVGSAVPPARCS